MQGATNAAQKVLLQKTLPQKIFFERIVFENDACLVINKLAGVDSETLLAPHALATNLAIGEEACFPVHQIATIGREACFPVHQIATIGREACFPVHRLDTPVSGCLLLAKNPRAAASLSAAFREHRVEKRYWAIVEKPVAKFCEPVAKFYEPVANIREKCELVHWLSFDRAKNKSFAYNEERPGSKKAISSYSILGSGKNYLFLEIELVTGRHHQIRAQLAAAGMHIKGDLKYGARRSEKSGGIRLHAHALTFPAPPLASDAGGAKREAGGGTSGSIIEAKALPPDMDALWTAFYETAFHETASQNR